MLSKNLNAIKTKLRSVEDITFHEKVEDGVQENISEQHFQRICPPSPPSEKQTNKQKQKPSFSNIN